MPTLEWTQRQIYKLGFSNIEVIEDPNLDYAPQAFAEFHINEPSIIWISSGVLDMSKDGITMMMAHEVGHIIHGHKKKPRIRSITMRKMEKEADKFAKYLMREQGWTEKRLNKAFKESLGMTESEWNSCESVVSRFYPSWNEVWDNWYST